MAVKNIKLGQVWRQDASGQDYLVTKVYSEVFSQYAVLRPAEVNAPDAPVVKVKVAKAAEEKPISKAKAAPRTAGPRPAKAASTEPKAEAAPKPRRATKAKAKE